MATVSEPRWRQLVHAIQASPDDDAPRLVAADWLTERGDPRGEHVVLQIELARLHVDDPRRALLLERLTRIEPTWLLPLRALGAAGDFHGGSIYPPQLVRGFVAHATLQGRHVANAGELLRIEPVTELTLESGGLEALARAAAAPELARLRGLTLGARYQAGHEVVVRSPHLGPLRSLAILRSDPAVRAALPATGARPQRLLAALDDATATALATTRVLERAVYLSIGGRDLGDAGAIALARAPLDHLEELDLSDSNVGVDGLAALAPRLGRLTRLDLGRCPITPEVVPLLAAHASGGRLRRLGLAGVEPAAVVDALLDLPALAGLEALDLRHARFSLTSLQLFLAGSRMRRVAELPEVDWTSSEAIMVAFPGLQLTPLQAC